MTCDMSVTVTRTSRVTRHETSRVTQRVSHATTTTPHHTMSWVTSICGWSVAKSALHLKSLTGPNAMQETTC